jgi:hypothetical protein
MSYETPEPVPYDPPDKEFKLEAVVVCDHYSDFLRCTLPTNKFLFDKIVVVTSFEDKDTQRICEFLHVECIKTDSLEARKGHFCKAHGINEGLTALSLDDWVVHIDADIWLPPQTKILIQRAGFAKRMIYGIDRFMVKGHRKWDQFLANPRLQHENECWIHMDAFPLGTRVMQINLGGYFPLGFFQMWNPNVSGIHTYPQEHTTAARTDVQFAQQWPRGLRASIPEIVGYHLESVDAAMAANWNGRTTKQFSFEAEAGK